VAAYGVACVSARVSTYLNTPSLRYPARPPPPPHRLTRQICGHSPLRHYQYLQRLILNPIKQHGYSGPGRDALVRLRSEVLDGLLLRRTKAGRAADLALPTRTITLRDDLMMDAYEADFYEALYTQSKAKFNTYVAVSSGSGGCGWGAEGRACGSDEVPVCDSRPDRLPASAPIPRPRLASGMQNNVLLNKCVRCARW
jgi:hypothetical protein